MFFVYFLSHRSDHMETINRYDRSTIFSATITVIVAIVVITWKPAFIRQNPRALKWSALPSNLAIETNTRIRWLRFVIYLYNFLTSTNW